MGLRKFKSAFVLIGFIWVSFNVAANAATKGYKDVPNGHWAKNSVVKVVDEYQLMSGDPNGNFGGSRALSRYEFAKTLSNMIEYYNREIETDRKDLENVVGVLELFQTEMKKMEEKVAQANEQVENQNKTIVELNELVITVADELGGLNTGGIPPATQEELNIIKSRVELAEMNIANLSDKGLVVDTLIKGMGNDAKHLGQAIAHVVKKPFHRDESEDLELPLSEVQPSSSNVEAELAAPASSSTTTTTTEESHIEQVQTSAPAPVPVQTETEQTQEFINNLDGYYAAPSEQQPVEYLTPVQGK